MSDITEERNPDSKPQTASGRGILYATCTASINVHVFADGSSLLDDNRMIRDYLREHPDAAAEYAAVKQRALDQGHADLRSYSHAKGAHVAALRESAYRWKQRKSRG